MDCPHSETTLAWMYGEADDGHLAHVGTCTSCQALLEEHEAVLALAAGSLPANSAPASRRIPWAALALAAVVLLSLGIWAAVPGASQRPVQIPEPSSAEFASVELPELVIDGDLDDLDAELSDLIADLEAL